jgi:large subunit ribosomal protein L29
MRIHEIREMSAEDVKARIADTRREIVELRFQMAAHKLESPARLRLARRQLSRLLTIQTEAARKQEAKK